MSSIKNRDVEGTGKNLLNHCKYFYFIVALSILATSAVLEVTTEGTNDSNSNSDFSLTQAVLVGNKVKLNQDHRSSNPIKMDPTPLPPLQSIPNTALPPTPTPTPTSVSIIYPNETFAEIPQLKFKESWPPLTYLLRRILHVDSSEHELPKPPDESLKKGNKGNTVTISLQGIQPGFHTVTILLLNGEEVISSASTSFNFVLKDKLKNHKNIPKIIPKKKKKKKKKKEKKKKKKKKKKKRPLPPPLPPPPSPPPSLTSLSVEEIEEELNSWDHLLFDDDEWINHQKRRAKLEKELHNRIFDKVDVIDTKLK
jgi:hypothetical protein